jgi:hypothetical protein
MQYVRVDGVDSRPTNLAAQGTVRNSDVGPTILAINISFCTRTVPRIAAVTCNFYDMLDMMHAEWT